MIVSYLTLFYFVEKPKQAPTTSPFWPKKGQKILQGVHHDLHSLEFQMEYRFTLLLSSFSSSFALLLIFKLRENEVNISLYDNTFLYQITPVSPQISSFPAFQAQEKILFLEFMLKFVLKFSITELRVFSSPIYFPLE